MEEKVSNMDKDKYEALKEKDYWYKKCIEIEVF